MEVNVASLVALSWTPSSLMEHNSILFLCKCQCTTHTVVISTLCVSLQNYIIGLLATQNSFYIWKYKNLSFPLLLCWTQLWFKDTCLLTIVYSLLQEILRLCPDHNVAPAVAHFLNCFAGKVLAASTKASAGSSTQSKTHQVCTQS